MANRADIAIIQHEYGSYGGPDGDEVLALLDAISVPRVVVLHTVLTEPISSRRLPAPRESQRQMQLRVSALESVAAQ